MGQLSVSGTRIVSADGTIAALAGPSFFWTNTDFNQFRFYNAEAAAFFREIANLYGDTPNLIYEIYNEPGRWCGLGPVRSNPMPSG